MKIGLATPIGNSPGRDFTFLRDFAQAIEGSGFNSMWFPEHIVFFDANEYESKYPYSEDGSPPWQDGMGIYDPLVLATVAAQFTTRLRFSTSVLLLTLRPPLLTAKEVMTVDHATDGRFEFGVGSGWSAEEYGAVGVPFERRGKRFDEYIESIKTAWRDDRASYHGEFVDFENVIMGPKPITPGGPPFLIGGDSKAAMLRAARLGDGWYGWWANYELEPHLAQLRELLAEHGRDENNDFQLKLGLPFKGHPDELPAKIEEAKRLGVRELVIALPVSSKRMARDLAFWADVAGVSDAA